MPVIPAYAIAPESFTALAPHTTVYSTESNRSAAGFNLATSTSKLNSFKEIGTVLPDPLGVADSTSSKDPNCTVSENLNTRFPLVATNAISGGGLYIESVGAVWSSVAT